MARETPKLRTSSPIDSPSARSASMNWRGQPLTGHEVVVNLIAGTTTRTGLTVHAELDNTVYPKASRSPTVRCETWKPST